MAKRKNKRSDLGELVMEISQHYIDTVPLIEKEKKFSLVELEELQERQSITQSYFSMLDLFAFRECSKKTYQTRFPDFVDLVQKGIEEKEDVYSKETNPYVFLAACLGGIPALAVAFFDAPVQVGIVSLTAIAPMKVAITNKNKRRRFHRSADKFYNGIRYSEWNEMFRNYGSRVETKIHGYARKMDRQL